MLISPNQIEKFANQLGSKTVNLKKLFDAGFKVPSFVAVPSSVVVDLIDASGKVNQKKMEELVRELKSNFPAKSYAVRSSALIEDNAESAMAGQFRTKLDVRIDGLVPAIEEVLKQARDYLKGDLSKFSFIIQEFIQPDYAGVTFTRNPAGGREMVVEYYRGAGEDLVSGKIKPERVLYYWNQPDVDLNLSRGVLNARVAGRDAVGLPDFYEAVLNFKKIEEFFGGPQDIEWCVKNGIWYFLQARPITTITGFDYEQALFLDEVLSKKQKYIFEKTEISEIAPRPTLFTFSLLEKIYGKNGPVERVYKKYGVKYLFRPFLKIVGNELFVDREEEIKTLLPAYSYLEDSNFKPGLNGFNGLWRTVLNFWNLNRIPTGRFLAMVESIKIKLDFFRVQNVKNRNVKNSPNQGIEQLLQNFHEDYELIFEVNLLAQKTLQSLNFLLKKEKVTAAEILGSDLGLECNLFKDFRAGDENLYGNSLEIADESKFFAVIEKRKNGKVDEWFETLSGVKKSYCAKIIKEAQIFNRLREYGRWLTVEHINLLRGKLLQIAVNFKDPKNIYFAKPEEICGQFRDGKNLNGSVLEEACLKRKSEYQKYSKFNLPQKLTDHPILHASGGVLGVSSGVAKGLLVDLARLVPAVSSGEFIPATGVDEVDESADGVGKILYVKMMTPDLTAYFPKIKGIVAEQGGLLSHLAIMARENGIPAVVNFDLAQSGIKIGDHIKIDGATGAIEKIS